MKRKNSGFIGTTLAAVFWLVGILVSLAIGFALTSGTLSVPWIPSLATVIAGWIVVGGTLLGTGIAIISKFME